jgi:hypothetical protein
VEIQMSANTTRRLTATAGAVLVVAASAVALSGTGPAQAGSTPACRNADLHATYHHQDAAMSHTFGRIVLTNTSGRACTTGGYGGLSYVGQGNGTQIGAPAVRIDGPAAIYVLGPGQRLRSEISEATALVYPKKRCHPTHVDGFRVYVPNSFTSQFIKHPTTGCRNDAVKLMTQKPYRRP